MSEVGSAARPAVRASRCCHHDDYRSHRWRRRMSVSERLFEDAIEEYLLGPGKYLRSDRSNFDSNLGLDTAELFAFIGQTQIDEWEALLGRYGDDPDEAQRGFARRLAKELDERGAVDVLRHGVV